MKGKIFKPKTGKTALVKEKEETKKEIPRKTNKENHLKVVKKLVFQNKLEKKEKMKKVPTRMILMTFNMCRQMTRIVKMSAIASIADNRTNQTPEESSGSGALNVFFGPMSYVLTATIGKHLFVIIAKNTNL